LGLVPANTLLEPRNLLSEHKLLGCEAVSASPQLDALPVQHGLHFRVGGIRGKNGRSFECVHRAHFGFQPNLHREQPVLLQHEPSQLGFRGGVVHAYKHFVWLDDIALLYRQLANNAAFQVLDELVLACSDKRAGRDDRTSQRGDSSPDAETTQAERENAEADEHRNLGTERNPPVPLVDAGVRRPHCELAIPGVCCRLGSVLLGPGGTCCPVSIPRQSRGL
jgi:hypothetical protein